MFGFKNRRKQLLQEIETHIEIETQDDRGYYRYEFDVMR